MVWVSPKPKRDKILTDRKCEKIQYLIWNSTMNEDFTLWCMMIHMHICDIIPVIVYLGDFSIALVLEILILFTGLMYMCSDSYWVGEAHIFLLIFFQTHRKLRLDGLGESKWGLKSLVI